MDSVLSPSLFLYVYLAFENFNNRKIELLCKFPVAVIVCRNSHDCACSIAYKNVVRNPNWNKLIVYRVYCVASAENTCLVFCKVGALKVALLCGSLDIVFNSLFLFRRCKLFDKLMLWSDNHVSCAKKCVAACCVDAELVFCRFSVFVGNLKAHLAAFASANPVFLHQLYAFRPVKRVKVFKKLVRIVCDSQNPLADCFVCYSCAAAVAFSVFNFFVCKTSKTAWAPVNRCFCFISKTFLVKLKENPLSPFVVFRLAS